jgi:hypothetical protein
MTDEKFTSHSVVATKSATTTLTSFRDDEETETCRGYQRDPLTLSTRSKSRTNV